MTGSQTIDYEALQQDALRGVVRAVLTRVAKSGLPGDHHFYISFDTSAPGVSVSKRLKEKYPKEMTIVLQHRFWDLIVTEERFEVKLSFDSIPERLVVPYAALKVFFDPSVRYGLQFEDVDGLISRQANASNADDDEPPSIAPRSVGKARPRTAKKSKADGEQSPRSNGAGPAAATTKPAAIGPQVSTLPSPSPADSDAAVAPVPAAGAQIVSLDQFRKK